jgi:hypothetical protein
MGVGERVGDVANPEREGNYATGFQQPGQLGDLAVRLDEDDCLCGRRDVERCPGRPVSARPHHYGPV